MTGDCPSETASSSSVGVIRSMISSYMAGCFSDEALNAWLLKSTGLPTISSCTCKMGPVEDPMAVVDQHGKIYGSQNIRVADASIRPN